jgi:NDP-sugar pyrophosphorylase family protein
MQYIRLFSTVFPSCTDWFPWQVTCEMASLVQNLIAKLDGDYEVRGDSAIHRTAVIEPGAELKGPVVIGKNCFISGNACLRGGVYLGEQVTIGRGCEIKSSAIFPYSAAAHFNFVGDSLLGSHVNIEAGAVITNYYNERMGSNVFALYNKEIMDCGISKFGALVGDDTKIGANAVLSPGTILLPGTVVNRLELIQQVTAR